LNEQADHCGCFFDRQAESFGSVRFDPPGVLSGLSTQRLDDTA